jgi:hypothetical protein
MSQHVLEGIARRWGVGHAEGQGRRFDQVWLTYGDLKGAVLPYAFNAETGKGEGRDADPKRVKALRKELEAGRFTPGAFAASIGPEHAQHLHWGADGVTYHLELDSQHYPLRLTDGTQRLRCLEEIRALYEERRKGTDSESERQLWAAKIYALDNQPISVMIHFDGDSQQDFVNLQESKKADATHKKSLKIIREARKAADRTTLDLGLELHKNPGSPFFDCLRFDSRPLHTLPFAAICPSGPADRACSVVGMSEVGVAYGKDAKWLSQVLTDSYQFLLDHESTVPALDWDKLLATQDNCGGKSSAALMLGIGTCMSYRLAKRGAVSPDAGDYKALAVGVLGALDKRGGRTDGGKRRILIGEFAKSFFADSDCEKYEGVPEELVGLLSPGTFALSPKPKKKKESQAKPEKKPAKTRKKATQAAPAQPKAQVAPAALDDENWDIPGVRRKRDLFPKPLPRRRDD